MLILFKTWLEGGLAMSLQSLEIEGEEDEFIDNYHLESCPELEGVRRAPREENR